MSRSLLVLLLVLVVIVGGVVWLAKRGGQERPQTQVEKVVPLANLS